MRNKPIFQVRKPLIILMCLLVLTVVAGITVSCGKTDENIISVSDVRPAVVPVDVSLSDREMEVGICTVHEITVTGGEKITLRSSDDSVAAVDAEGKITGIGVGECDITARNEFGKTATCHVTVKKSVFLTIDDGPLGCCSSILRVLRLNDVKATFFVVKTNNFDMVKIIHEEGHCIGLHTYTHNLNVCYASEYSYYAGLEKLKQLVEEKTGERPDIIRFPGGTNNTVMNWQGMRRLVSGLDDLGYRVFDWTISSGDAAKERISSQQATGNVLRGFRGNVNIILMHDWEPTPKALGVIIPYLREKGYTFDTLDHYAEHSFRAKTWYERSQGDKVIPCTAIVLNPSEMTLSPSASQRLIAKMEPETSTDYLRFVSDDVSIATVTLEGVITGVRPGTTKIRAIASSGEESVCYVTVA